MAKALPVKDDNGVVRGYGIKCPACGNLHVFYTDYHGDGSGSNWTFNGDIENPTFNPSMLVYPHEGGQKRCHSFVRNGKIQYLNDCEHDLKGQTVELPNF